MITREERRDVVSELRGAGCVFAEDEAAILIGAAGTPDELARLVRRRVAGFPLEQIVGWAEFCGLRIDVEPGVFVPRRRSELLARQAVARAGRGSAVVDLCCGAGGVGAAVLAAVDGIELHASDIEPAAVRCARRNIAAGGRVYEGNLYEPLPSMLRGRIDVLVANTPYVPTGEIALMPHEARVHEPAQALDGGPDGLDVQRRVCAAAPEWLAPGGHLLIETSQRQAPEAAEEFARNGLIPQVARSDELDATVVIGIRSSGV